MEAPWLNRDTDVPATLCYPDVSMAEMVRRTAQRFPTLCAYEFMGRRVTYRAFFNQICRCARALKAWGLQPEERVTICMPNTPQAVILFYAVNMVGAVVSMVHPLSSEGEMAFFLETSRSRWVLTLERLYPKWDRICRERKMEMLLITRLSEAVPLFKRPAYALAERHKAPSVPKTVSFVRWNDFLAKGDTYTGAFEEPRRGDDPAVILYSGGTTGTTKGVLLTNRNFNALGLQTGAAGDCSVPGHTMLAIMPLFHGFGLGTCVHTAFLNGMTCLLIPRFHIKTYPRLLRKYRPNYMVGVPTLFEAMLRNPAMDKVDLSCLEGVFSGGDSLSTELKHKVDRFLREHGARVPVREGYGATECVAASCLTPRDTYKEGSIGVPFPDTFYKIVTPQTEERLPYGAVGEICISGPTVMSGYVDQPEETARTLRTHADGRVWLHTGDLGCMDEEGFVYFKQRLKRMIVTSGYNVYPSQIENVINAHEGVLCSAVIGVKDDYRMQRVKAFVVLQPGYAPTEEYRRSLEAHCRRNIARYALPKTFEFREDLPRTRVGKVAYTELQRQEDEAKALCDATDEEGEQRCDG